MEALKELIDLKKKFLKLEIEELKLKEETWLNYQKKEPKAQSIKDGIKSIQEAIIKKRKEIRSINNN